MHALLLAAMGRRRLCHDAGGVALNNHSVVVRFIAMLYCSTLSLLQFIILILQGHLFLKA
jgi:hypothetical protein